MQDNQTDDCGYSIVYNFKGIDLCVYILLLLLLFLEDAQNSNHHI